MKKGYVALAAILIGCFLLVGILSHRRDSQSEVIRIGYLPLTASLPLFVGIQERLFNQEGITVKTIEFPTSDAMVQALVSGRIDVQIGASSVVIATVSNHLRDGEIQIFMVNSFTPERYLSSIVVRVNSGFDDLGDLRGKRIATFPGSTMRKYTELLFRAQKVQPAAILELPAQTQIAALQAGSVDALVALEPIGTIAETNGTGRRLLAAPIERFVLNPWVSGTHSFSRAFAERNPGGAEAVRRVLAHAVELVESEPVRSRLAMIPYTPVKDSSVARALPLPNYLTLEQIDTTSLQRLVDLQVQEGLMEHPLDITKLLYQLPHMR